MAAYYNEVDEYAAAWLRNLIAAGVIADGTVDERSIEDVHPADLRGFTQVHFFAGIGVWSYALRRAGWSDDRRIWTGSCPCQPFSAAGKGTGFDDQRHLWPAFHHLIAECSPAVVLGEQVAGEAADPWIDLVHADLEALDYAFGCVAFPAAGVGAPHIRDRIYWVANANNPGRLQRGWSRQHREWQARTLAAQRGAARRLDNADQPRLERLSRYVIRAQREDQMRLAAEAGVHGPAAAPDSFWAGADWLACADDRWRPVEPGASPVVDGATVGVGSVCADWRTAAQDGQASITHRIKGYGNALNAEQARAFIEIVKPCIIA
jgi:DNA (cytosine-5)-methyltransferase 1